MSSRRSLWRSMLAAFGRCKKFCGRLWWGKMWLEEVGKMWLEEGVAGLTTGEDMQLKQRLNVQETANNNT